MDQVHRVVKEERDGRIVSGDEPDDPIDELSLLEARAVQAVRRVVI